MISAHAEPVALADKAACRIAGTVGRLHLPDWSAPTAVPRALRIRRLIAQFPPGTPVISLAGTPLLAAVPLAYPIIQVTDTSFAALAAEYPAFQRLSRLTRAQATVLEGRVAARTARFAVATEWSRQAVHRDMRVPLSRIQVIPFGPAIDGRHASAQLRSERSAPPPWKILLVASDWERKGGDLAVAAVAELRRRGHQVRLTVVGGLEPRSLPSWVERTGRLQQAELSELYRTHHILLEPARAAAGGVLITDALSHGLPVLTHAVGGATTLVQDGRTGWVAEPSSSADHLVNVFEHRVLNADLPAFSAAAVTWARREASWATWGTAVAELAASLQRPCDAGEGGRSSENDRDTA